METAGYGMRVDGGAPSASRRSFLKGSGLALAGTAALVGGSAACAGASEAAADGTEQQDAAQPAMDVEVFEADVLIIGAGNAASAAAWSVAREGKSMLIVNKGPVAQGGSTGTSWAGFTTITDLEPETPLSEYMQAWINKPIGAYLVNHQLYRNALDLYKEGSRDYDSRVRAVDAINNGLYMVSRDEDGQIIPFGGNMAQHQLYRREMDSIVAKGIPTLDQTMVTDLIIEDGVCCGAMGLHLPTGRLRVMRAKATIVATAGCTTNYGTMVGIRPVSGASTDNSGELELAAWRHGLGIAETEFGQWDCVSVEPSTFTLYNVDAQKAAALLDVNGDRVFPDDDKNVNDRNYFSQRVAEVVVKEGRGTEDGKLLVDMNDEQGAYIKSNAKQLLDDFNFHPENNLIPVDLEMYERGGAPIVDENIMTEAKGLFWTRGAGIYGENGGSCLWQNHVFGNYAGLKACEWADGLDAAPAFDWTAVENEGARLMALRSNEVEDGIRPLAIRRKIAKAFYQGFGCWRTKENLDASLAELERIEAEDMPRMVVTDDHMAWNREWKEAIENECLLASSLMGIRATLEREESRGGYIRDDFPEQDDENWGCLLVCRDVDGQMAFEKYVFPGADVE